MVDVEYKRLRAQNKYVQHLHWDICTPIHIMSMDINTRRKGHKGHTYRHGQNSLANNIPKDAIANEIQMYKSIVLIKIDMYL